MVEKMVMAKPEKANDDYREVVKKLRDLFDDIDAIQNLRQTTANQQLILFYDRLLRNLHTELDAFAQVSSSKV